MKLPKLIFAAGIAALSAAGASAQNFNAAQQVALNSVSPALVTAVTTARNALTAAALAMPVNQADLAAKANAVRDADAALALARAEVLARIQASPNKLNPTQLATARNNSTGGRGGAGAPPAKVPFANAPKILLWPNGAPGAFGNADTDKPLLATYLVKRAPGEPPAPAVVIAPGGAYLRVSTGGGEGDSTAEWFNSLGVSAFVLLYRVTPYHYPAETDDGQRAIRLVRARAAEFGIDPNQIGMLGFSAGGHLTGATATIFDAGKPGAPDPIDRVSSRPDFAILMYAVLSFAPDLAGPNPLTAYASSGLNLLGANADPALIQQMSIENRVTRESPPMFLYNGTADPLVAPENAFRVYNALRKAGVAAEVHTLENGAHATGISRGDPIRGSLPDLLKTWLRLRGIVSVDIP